MAKPVNFQTVALQALTQALTDPAPRVLLGSGKQPGFFKGSTQTTRAAAKLCEERQWLVGTGAWVGKGASKKQQYRLSPAGLQAVLDQSETHALLRGLSDALREQVQWFGSVRDQLGQVLGGLQPLAEVVATLVKKVEPPDVEGVLRRLNSMPGPPAPPPPNAPDWLDRVIELAATQQQRDQYQPLALPALYAALQPLRPGLTIGQFHDGLRLLRDRGRIRLSPYTRALATIDDARTALFLDGEVMYYVELP
jgi:hypothetical protein